MMSLCIKYDVVVCFSTCILKSKNLYIVVLGSVTPQHFVVKIFGRKALFDDFTEISRLPSVRRKGI